MGQYPTSAYILLLHLSLALLSRIPVMKVVWSHVSLASGIKIQSGLRLLAAGWRARRSPADCSINMPVTMTRGESRKESRKSSRAAMFLLLLSTN